MGHQKVRLDKFLVENGYVRESREENNGLEPYRRKEEGQEYLGVETMIRQRKAKL